MRKYLLVGALVAVALVAVLVGCQSEQRALNNQTSTEFTATYAGGTSYQVRAPDGGLHMLTFVTYYGTAAADHELSIGKVLATLNGQGLSRLAPGRDIARNGLTGIGIDGHAEAAKLYGDPTLFTSFGLNQYVPGLEGVYVSTQLQAEDLANLINAWT